MVFIKTVSGYTPGFEDPYWTSKCEGYRIASMKVMPAAVKFRLLKAYKQANGYPWIAAGTGGYDSKPLAILGANVFHLALRRKNYVPEKVVTDMVKRLGVTREQVLAVLVIMDNTARSVEELIT